MPSRWTEDQERFLHQIVGLGGLGTQESQAPPDTVLVPAHQCREVGVRHSSYKLHEGESPGVEQGIRESARNFRGLWAAALATVSHARHDEWTSVLHSEIQRSWN